MSEISGFHVLPERETTAEDLEALRRLAWFVKFIEAAAGNVPEEHRERADRDLRALEHCYRLLAERLAVGLVPFR